MHREEEVSGNPVPTDRVGPNPVTSIVSVAEAEGGGAVGILGRAGEATGAV